MGIALLSSAPVWAQPTTAAPAPSGGAKETTSIAPASSAPPASVSPEVRAAYDAAFERSLEKPADPQTLIEFAEAAVQFGDLEGAISALERLLLLDADQAEVKLELGVLYFRLGSTEAARTYLEGACTTPSTTADVKQRAKTFMDQSGSSGECK